MGSLLGREGGAIVTGRVVAPGRGTVGVPGRFGVVDADDPRRGAVVEGLIAGCFRVVAADDPGRTLDEPGRLAVVVEAALPGRIDWAVAEELKPKAKRAAASMEV